MKKLTGLLLFLFFIGVGNSHAQKRMLTGKVTEAFTHQPLPGATLLLQGKSYGTTTDAQGKYSIEVNPHDTLIISFVGMQTISVPVKSLSTLNVVLHKSSIPTEEVLVVAFGRMNKDAYTGSASILQADELASRSATNVLEILEGSMPGVQVNSSSGQPGSSPDIRIRGIGSLYASAAPLIVVDGVPYIGDLANLSLTDIENVSVLKDAASAALYGSRGANGVILITTRQGSPEHNFYKIRMTQGFTSPSLPEYDRVNAYTYYPLMWEAYRNSLVYRTENPLTPEQAALIASGGSASPGITALLGNNPFNVPDQEIIGTDGKLNPQARLLYPGDLDWREAMIRPGYRQDYSISAGGGTAKTDYYLSLGYMKEKGYILHSDFQRVNLRTRLNIQPTPWLKTGLNLSGIIHKTSRIDTETNTSLNNPFYFSRLIAPIYPIHRHEANGDYILDASGNTLYDWENRCGGAFPGYNIIAQLEWDNQVHRQNVVNSRAYAEIKLPAGFYFTLQAAYDFTYNQISEYNNAEAGSAAGLGRSKKTNDRYDAENYSQLLQYKRAIQHHHADILLGHESFSNTYRYLYGSREGEFSVGNDELTNFTELKDLTSQTDQYRTEGYFGRLNYDFAYRYFFSFSYRRDGSSRFHPDARWGNFWSAGIAWNAAREKFLQTVPWINRLKWRASVGQTGNDQTDSWYTWQNLYSVNNNGEEAGFIQNTAAGNPRLKWETNTQYDIALEFEVFRRFRGTLEFYHRESSDLLFSVPLPLSSGKLTQWQNTGTMYNRGIELTLDADIVKKKDLLWNLQILLSHYRNKITALPQKEISAGLHKRMEGYSAYEYWLPVYEGADPATGSALYRQDIKDASEQVTGYTTTPDINQATSYFCGSALPDLIGALNSRLTYKGLEADFRFTFQTGGKTYDSSYSLLMHSGVYGKALHKDILKRWQKPGDITDVPKLGDSSDQTVSSSRWLTNASFLALKHIALSYRLPDKFSRWLDLTTVRFYASGENLFLCSHRKGMNPQNQFSGTSANTYSPVRIFSVGIEVEL